MNDDLKKLPSYIVERVIEKNGNGFSHLKDLVFFAIILGAGATIWAQQNAINTIRTDIAVLKLKCSKQPVERGAPSD